MRFFGNFSSRFTEGSELIVFLWKMKLWFLIPFIVILIIFGFLFIFAQAMGVAPFIYTLF